MNRRVKTERGTANVAKHTRATTKKSTPIKKTTRKRVPRMPLINVKDDSSDEEFEMKRVSKKKNKIYSLRSRTNSDGGTCTTSNITKNDRRSVIPTNIYQISDSSDDENNFAQIVNDSQLINLCETDNSVMKCRNNILDEVIHIASSKKVDYSHPSTSKNQAISSTSNSDMPDFIDNTFGSNKNALDENHLKSLKDLNAADELLTSSLNLINNNDNRNFETHNSVIKCRNNMLDEVIHTASSKKVDYSHPSTSKDQAISSSNSDMPDFIDNILSSNKNLLDENYLKPLKDLHETTDKLLASSWNLINNNDNRNFEDSIIYIGADKEAENDRPVQENNTQQSNGPVTEKLKAQCPICLEHLGKEPVSSTICGHIFCTPCIQNCIKSLKKCPTCRKHLTLKRIHPLFLF